MMKNEVKVPFLFVNPKSYFYGDKCLEFARSVDSIAQKTGLQIFFTCPYTDLRMVVKETKNLIVTAQSMDPLKPGRGMGAILPESLKAAGTGAVVLNHAENTKTVTDLYRCIIRAKELQMLTIVCADSAEEAHTVAMMKPDIILAEPTNLIGTGITADDQYTVDVVDGIRKVNPKVKIMIASGITTAEDCSRVIMLGADGTGSTSGIVMATDPVQRVREMADAIIKAVKDREQNIDRRIKT